jgi:Domain of unknown function (DUF4845)
MNLKNRQRGVTLLGFAILLVVVGFFAYAVMKLWPAYVEYYGVVRSMKIVQQDPQASTGGVDFLRSKLNVQFDLQYVDEKDVPMSAISLNTQNGNRSLTIAWDRDIPFLYNVDLLVHFTHTVDLARGAAAAAN